MRRAMHRDAVVVREKKASLKRQEEQTRKIVFFKHAMSPDQDRLTETELREICELWLERHDLDETDEQTDNSRDVHGRKKLSGMQALALEGLKKRENSEWRGAGIEVPDLRAADLGRGLQRDKGNRHDAHSTGGKTVMGAKPSGASFLSASSIVIALFVAVCLNLICILTPVLRPFYLAYFIYCWLDKTPWRGGRSDIPFVTWLDQMVGIPKCLEYFPLRLVKDTKDQFKTGAHLFAIHPHGVLGMSHSLLFTSPSSNFAQLFPGLSFRLCTLNLNFLAPFIREPLLARGFISCDKDSISHVLKKGPGHAVGLVVGGAKESLFAGPGRNTLVLAKRKGFVKLAIQNGANLVPVYSFGEQRTFSILTGFERIQRRISKLVSFAPVLFYGRWGLPIPYSVPINSVVGDPIPCEQNDNPSQEMIDDMHALYCERLKALFDKYKDQYDPDRVEELTFI
ncbi:MAG: hypothetical protein SGCHY_002965 [Lobulomycetales sp.]